MKNFKFSEEIMAQRRSDRLKHLNVFMTHPELQNDGGRKLSRMSTHHLLTGFFQNSYWKTAWWCFWTAVTDTYKTKELLIQLWWYENILKLTPHQIDERIAGHSLPPLPEDEEYDGPDSV